MAEEKVSLKERFLQLLEESPDLKTKEVAERLGVDTQRIYQLRSDIKRESSSPNSAKVKNLAKYKKKNVVKQKPIEQLSMSSLVKRLRECADFAEQVLEHQRKRAEELFL